MQESRHNVPNVVQLCSPGVEPSSGLVPQIGPMKNPGFLPGMVTNGCCHQPSLGLRQHTYMSPARENDTRDMCGVTTMVAESVKKSKTRVLSTLIACSDHESKSAPGLLITSLFLASFDILCPAEASPVSLKHSSPACMTLLNFPISKDTS